MDNIIETKLKDYDEKYYYYKHKSGLEIYLFAKEVSTSYAIFATKYGAIDNCFKTNKDNDYVRVPDGIAHYLEHKMFENEDGSDTMAKFAKNGAYDNAFTSSSITAYHFQCTSKFKENLEILLDYVTHPYYTKENVAKEQGIIGQEIRMGQDNPNRALYYGFLDSLYQKCNIKIDVLGTIDSIAKITPELLYSCYNTFYNMANMVLMVYGDHSMEEIVEVCDKIIPEKEQLTIERKYEEEPYEVNKKRVVKEFPVAKPLFIIGVKDNMIPKTTKECLKKSICADIAYDLLFGSSSEFFIKNFESGLVNRLYGGTDVNCLYNYGYVQGSSDDPDKVFELFKEYIEKKKETGLNRDDFERNKKVEYSNIVSMFDSYRVVNQLMLYLRMDNIKIEDYLDEFKNVSLEDVENFIKQHFKEDMYTITIVNPKK